MGPDETPQIFGTLLKNHFQDVWIIFTNMLILLRLCDRFTKSWNDAHSWIAEQRMLRRRTRSVYYYRIQNRIPRKILNGAIKRQRRIADSLHPNLTILLPDRRMPNHLGNACSSLHHGHRQNTGTKLPPFFKIVPTIMVSSRFLVSASRRVSELLTSFLLLTALLLQFFRALVLLGLNSSCLRFPESSSLLCRTPLPPRRKINSLEKWNSLGHPLISQREL